MKLKKKTAFQILLSVLVMFVVLLALPVAFAAEDFALQYTVATDSLCPSATGLFTFQVKNTGDTESKYTVNLAGSAANFATIVPTGFTLQPDKAKTIFVYVTPKSTSKQGSYDLKISVSTDSIVKLLDYKLNVLDCRELQIKAAEPVKTACPCELVKYDFLLSNLGYYQETYDIESSGAKAALSNNKINLAPKESKTIFAYVENICGLGAYDLTLTAKNEFVTKSATASLNIIPCFDFVLQTEKDDYSMCENTQEIIPVEVKNIGTSLNAYSLELNGPPWARLDKNTLSLMQGSGAFANIILKPEYSASGNFEILFKSTSEKGKVEAEKKLNINVRKCHSVLVEIPDEKDRICNALSNSYSALIKNNGEITETYSLQLNGPEWAKLSKNILTLKPGEEETIELAINPDFNTEAQDYTLEVIASTLDKGRVYSDSIKITTVTQAKCYEPKISIKDNSIMLNRDSASTIPVVIENKGTETATYFLSLSGTAVNFAQLNPSVATIAPSKAETVYIYIAPSVEIKGDAYSLTVLARLEDSTISDSKEVSIILNAPESEEIKPSEEITTSVAENITAGNETAVKITSVITKNYVASITVGIILLVLFALVIKFWGKLSGFFLEEDEEKKEIEFKQEPKEIYLGPQKKSNKLWYFLLLLLILAIAFEWKYLVFSKLLKLLLMYKIYIIVGFVILAVLLLFIRYRKNIVEFFEENEDVKALPVEKVKEPKFMEESAEAIIFEENKGHRLFWLVIIILLAISIWKIKFILAYKYYFLIGLIILIVLVLLIKYRKGIANFFEEDLDEDSDSFTAPKEIKEEKTGKESSLEDISARPAQMPRQLSEAAGESKSHKKTQEKEKPRQRKRGIEKTVNISSDESETSAGTPIGTADINKQPDKEDLYY